MHLNPTVYSHEVPILLGRFFQLVEWKIWKKHIDVLERQIAELPLIKFFVHERHWLELELYRIRRQQIRIGRLPSIDSSYETWRALGFACLVAKVFSNLTTDGQKNLAGRLRDGLRPERGLTSLEFEFDTITHLMAKGYSIEFNDLECAGGYDFRAYDDCIDIEVECKTVTADIGRRIHQRAMIEFGRALEPHLNSWIEDAEGGILVHVVFPERLTRDSSYLSSVATRVSDLYRQDGLPVETNFNNTQIRISSFDVPPSLLSPQISEEEANLEWHRFVENSLGFENPSALFRWRVTGPAIAVVVECQERDTVLTSLYESLKDSAKTQFTGSRPAYFAVRLLDVSPSQLRTIAGKESRRTELASALQLMTSRLVEKRPHIHSVAYTPYGETPLTREPNVWGCYTSFQDESIVYTLRNSEHPNASDKRFSAPF